MGNHEYCVDCGENDYHYGQPCNPEKLAAKQEERRLEQKRKALASKRVDELAVKLMEDLGVRSQRDQHGNLVVSKWDLISPEEWRNP